MDSKATIIAQLQREILSLGGIRHASNDVARDQGLQFMQDHFPQRTFPLGAIHEFLSSSPEDISSTSGFIAGLISTVMPGNGVLAWISRRGSIFPPSLALYNLDPSKTIFIHPGNEKELLWVMEEVLKCDSVRAVVAELEDVIFTNSRRFQLAVEKSRVTGFIINKKAGKQNNNACFSRWRVNSLPSYLPSGLPGVGPPRWTVELQKIRNGKPGSWQVEWVDEKLMPVPELKLISQEEYVQKQTG